MSLRIDYFSAHANRLGESPLWDAARRRLWWVDAGRRAILAADADGTVVVDWRYDHTVGSIGLADDGLIAALADGFYRIDGETGRETPIAPVALPAPEMRLNDGKADRFGRFLSGHMHPAGGKDGEVWRLDRDGSAHRLIEGLGVANAISFSPDGATLYVADTMDGMLRRHRYDGVTGAIGPREDLVDCRAHGSGADGATVDTAGNIWVALVLAQKIACFAPDGGFVRAIEMPIPYPSCPAFGGADMATLFVTTIADSGHRLTSDHPDAGRIVAVTGLGATGIAETPYRPAVQMEDRA